MTDPAASLLTVPPPRMNPATLAQHLHNHWGLTGHLSALTSERDLNFRLTGPTGDFVIKLTNPAEPAAMTDFQSRAFLHVAARDPDLPVQRLFKLPNNDLSLALPEGRLRVLSWLPGTPQHAAPRSHPQTRAIGHALARLTAALADFAHPAADHHLQWDIRRLPDLAPMVTAITDPSQRRQAAHFIATFTAETAPQLNALPRQIVHADFNPHNLLVSNDSPDNLTGILDFGDMVRTPRICDLAVAASYQIAAEDPLGSLSALITGYTARLPLTTDELSLLYDLITARLVTTLTITAWRAALYPDNAAYIMRNAPSAHVGLAALRALGRDTVTHTLTRAAGQEVS